MITYTYEFVLFTHVDDAFIGSPSLSNLTPLCNALSLISSLSATYLSDERTLLLLACLLILSLSPFTYLFYHLS